VQVPPPVPPGSSPPEPWRPRTPAGGDKTAMPWADRLERAPTFVSRQIAGETILVPIRQNMGDLESVYSLNEVGTRVWELLDGAPTLAEIRDRLADEFEVGAEEAERDLLEFLNQLQAIRAIRPAAPPAGERRP
jgi:hypothetical protein